MKIIKEGKAPQEKVLTGQCTSCGCVVEAKKQELVAGYYDQRDNCQNYSLKCPTPKCNSTINFYD